MLVRLYAALQYWTGSAQLLSVPGQVSQVIRRSPVLDRLYIAPLRALERLVRLYAALQYWTGSAQLLSGYTPVPSTGQALCSSSSCLDWLVSSQVIRRSPVLDRLCAAPVRAWTG
jgi:hypothetical protein